MFVFVYVYIHVGLHVFMLASLFFISTSLGCSKRAVLISALMRNSGDTNAAVYNKLKVCEGENVSMTFSTDVSFECCVLHHTILAAKQMKSGVGINNIIYYSYFFNSTVGVSPPESHNLLKWLEMQIMIACAFPLMLLYKLKLYQAVKAKEELLNW